MLRTYSGCVVQEIVPRQRSAQRVLAGDRELRWYERVSKNTDGMGAIRDYGPPGDQAKTVWGFQS